VQQKSTVLECKKKNQRMSPYPTYVLVTPAHNEEAVIEKTMLSVVQQSVFPLRWIIVSDGSTDRTDEIVVKYTPQYRWIELLHLPQKTERNFAGKVRAFNAGYESVKDSPFDIIGSLDADISFGPDYFAFLLEKFIQYPELGVAGTPFRQDGQQYDYRFSRKEHVSGACQLFRRKCFNEIGGYVPLKNGAIDLTAVVTARMKGWRTETFTDRFCVHNRLMGTAQSNLLSAMFKSGYYDYPMGVHPIWQFLRSIYQMSRRPYFLGGAMILSGYCWAMIKRAESPVSAEFIRFRKREQIRWLQEMIGRVGACKC
jgi:glycosyltransferase involved in cell wall biosynthesis